MSKPLDSLYTDNFKMPRTGPLYNAFSYPTKISAESTALMIAAHTDPGDHVLDVFAGSGSTAIGALLCARPTQRMIDQANALGLDLEWGARRVTTFDISEIGSLHTRVMTNAPDPDEFKKWASLVISKAEEDDFYRTRSPEGSIGQIRHVIWSDTIRCPKCGNETLFADQFIAQSPIRLLKSSRCECGFEGPSNKWPRATERVWDPWLHEYRVQRRRRPWLVYGSTGKKNWKRHATDEDRRPEHLCRSVEFPKVAPLVELDIRDLYRSGYHTGITHLHHIYTPRNFLAFSRVWQAIAEAPLHLQESLKLFALSYNASHSTLMTRVVLKKGSNDFVITGAQSGVLYISGLPVEKNVFKGLRRKITTFYNAFKILHGLPRLADVRTASSTEMELPPESVDYLFTDPPFGGNIPYSEVNQINELWLNSTTDYRAEAIVSPGQRKGIEDYQRLLTDAFANARHAMRDDAEGTIVFHSSSAAVWQALTRSIEDAGFTVIDASVLEKEQLSFKQVNGHTTVTGDPILRVHKGKAVAHNTSLSMDELINLSDNSSEAATERETQLEYSKLIGRAIVQGVPVTLDAKKFYGMRKAP